MVFNFSIDWLYIIEYAFCYFVIFCFCIVILNLWLHMYTIYMYKLGLAAQHVKQMSFIYFAIIQNLQVYAHLSDVDDSRNLFVSTCVLQMVIKADYQRKMLTCTMMYSGLLQRKLDSLIILSWEETWFNSYRISIFNLKTEGKKLHNVLFSNYWKAAIYGI